MVETNQTPVSQAPAAGQDNPSSSTPTKADVPTLGENFGKHDNTVVAHKIADHKRFVQVSVMVDGQWVNINNTLDQYNLQQDLNKVAKVVTAQVALISDAVDKANKAVDSANKAVENSNTNKTTIGSINSAVEEAKKAANDALEKLKNIASDETIKGIQDALSNTGKSLDQFKQDQLDQIATVKTQIVDAVKEAKEATDSLNAQLEPLQTAVKDAQDNATVAKQTAEKAQITAVNAQSDAATAVATAKQVTVDMSNVKSDVLDIQATASAASITAGNAASDAATAKVTASGASVVATNAKNDVAKVSTTVDDVNSKLSGISEKVDDVDGKVAKNQTELDQTRKALNLKADQTTVDNVKKTANDNSAALGVLSTEIKSKVDSTTVDKLINSKGFTTSQTVQTLISQKADSINQTISAVKATVDQNGKTISTTSDKVSNLSQTIDGLQTTVKDKVSQSQFTQLSNQVTTKVSTKDYETEIGLLEKNLNLRIKKGDVISQLNFEAGGDGLIQVANGKGKLLLDADSVVFKNKAFIPSAAIIDISADKIVSGTLDAGNIRVINLTADNIHGGTLDVGDMNIKNLTANDITTGTLTGVIVKSDNKKGQSFTLSNADMIWRDAKSAALIGRGLKHFEGSFENYDEAFTVAANSGIVLSGNLYIDEDNKVETTINDNSIKIMSEGRNHIIPDSLNEYGIQINAGMGASMRMYDRDNYDTANDPFSDYDTLTFSTYHNVSFNLGVSTYEELDGNTTGFSKSAFNIQKNNKVGAYFGKGNKGDEVWITAIGGTTHYTPLTVNSQLTADSIQANSLRVTGYKHNVVKTTQGYVGINAYETAEYYFGDIGEANTGNTGEVIIGIDKIFNETVNTEIEYQVFITPYSDCHIWVESRYDNRFVVRSDQPNAKFGWELKAKRKGYESDRLRHIDGIKEKEEMQL